MNARTFRISLALVTLVGGAHLNTARAAEAGAASCDLQAAGLYATAYATAYCGAKSSKPSSVVYSCAADGSVSIQLVTCVEPT